MAKSVLLLRALEILRTKQGVTISELAKELERSERTVYRYLSELSYELQTPIYCRDGMYRLAARSDAAGVFSLTADEALATHVALSSTAIASLGPLGAAARSALRKIESTIKNHTFEQLQDAQRKHLMAPTVLSNQSIDPDAAARICEAIKDNSRLRIVYRSQKSASVEDLTVDPYGMAFRRHNWYLVAYSRHHERTIQLRFSRVRSAESTGETFERPADFSLQEYYKNSWEVWAGGEETCVRIRFSPRVAPMIRENHYHPSQALEDTSDGGVILSVTVAGTEEIGSWALSYGAEAEVLEPGELRDRLCTAAREMVESYKEDA
ncbi:MAG: transcriptional regulator [Armatimonadota bacterium]|nr:transcriptional regulator [Armatimonadota bacterium]